MGTHPLHEIHPVEAIAEELSSFERVEFAAKVGAITLPLTYVSGYLIATSYLGTYGLHPDASDFFRTKYIYVGSLYLVFLALMTSMAWLVIQSVKFIKFIAGSTVIQDNPKEILLAKTELIARGKKISRRDRLRDLRWQFIVVFILIVFSFEILILNPDHIRWYLPSQVIFLLGVFLYQCSYYAEIRNPYTWGLVHGRTFIEYIRWMLSICQAMMVLCMIIIACELSRQLSHNQWDNPYERWVRVVKFFQYVSVAWEALAACSLFSSKHRLELIDKIPWGWWTPRVKENDGIHRPRQLRQFVGELGQILTSVCGCAHGYFFVEEEKSCPYWRKAGRAVIVLILVGISVWPIYSQTVPAYVSNHFPWNKSALLAFLAALLGCTALFLSFAVLANILYFIFMVGVRSHEMEGKSGKISRQGDVQKKKWEQNIQRIILIAILYIVSVLSFAYLVYPHIPEQKAGGNYARAARVTPHFADATTRSESPNYSLPGIANKKPHYIIIEEDSNWVYLADDGDPAGRPHEWSWPQLGQNPIRPTVYAIPRSSIMWMDFRPADATLEETTNAKASVAPSTNEPLR